MIKWSHGISILIFHGLHEHDSHGYFINSFSALSGKETKGTMIVDNFYGKEKITHFPAIYLAR